MKILTLVNQKGGVGKTTLACHLALAARDAGQRVLLIDLDTQGSASAILTQDAGIAQRDRGSAELFFPGRSLEPRSTPLGVDLLHGHQHLDRIDQRVKLEEVRHLRPKIEELAYERVVIDTPPAIGPRHLGPLFWTDLAITPLEPTSLAIQGLSQTIATLQFVVQLNERLKCSIAINRRILRSSGHSRNLEALEGILREKRDLLEVLKPYLTLRVAVADALDQGVPVWDASAADRRLRADWLSLCAGLVE